MPNDPVSAAGGGLPGSIPSGLTRLSIHELTVLYDAVDLAANAFMGVLGQPRTQGAARVAVEDELNRCNDLVTEIVEEVKARRPIESSESALRLRLITRHFVDEFSDPLDLIRFATDFGRGEMP